MKDYKFGDLVINLKTHRIYKIISQLDDFYIINIINKDMKQSEAYVSTRDLNRFFVKTGELGNILYE